MINLIFAPSRTLKKYRIQKSHVTLTPNTTTDSQPLQSFLTQKKPPAKCQLLVDNRGSDVDICDKVSPDILQLFPTLTVVFGSGGHHLRECWLLIGSIPSPTFFKTFSNIFTTSTLSTPKCSFSSQHEHSISPTILLKG